MRETNAPENDYANNKGRSHFIMNSIIRDICILNDFHHSAELKIKTMSSSSESSSSSSSSSSPSSEIWPSGYQESALWKQYPELYKAIFVDSNNVFVSGPGGCGKSFAVGMIKHEANRLGLNCSLTATSGTAAHSLGPGASTIHRWSGIRLGDKPLETILGWIEKRPDAKKRWREANLLVIDEISMLDDHTFELLSNVGKRIRCPKRSEKSLLKAGKTVEAFGGLKVIVTGDFCFAPNTPILTYQCGIKKAVDVQIGDVLMGDDSLPKTVVKLYGGCAPMYRVSTIGSGKSFIVTGNHTLCLRVAGQGLARWKGTDQTWIVQWWNESQRNVSRKEFSISKHGNESKTLAEAFASKIPQDYVLEITVNEYLSLSTFSQQELCCYKSAVEWPEEEKKVPIDPWSLGFCLTGKRNELTESDEKLKELDDRLRLYHILERECLPECYLFTSRHNRLQVLAGLIDGAGVFQNNRFRLSLGNKFLANQAHFIAESLGFNCSALFETTESERTIWNFFYGFEGLGEDVDQIPCRLNCLNKGRWTQLSRYSVAKFRVDPVGDGEFYGFETDGNHRFLLGDFTVTHNCQLPPVRGDFAFEAKLWEEMKFFNFRMTYPYRFPDPEHFAMLGRIRVGAMTAADIAKLRSRVVAHETYRKKILNGELFETIKPTRVFSLKQDVEGINQQELQSLEGEAFIFEATDTVIPKPDSKGRIQYRVEDIRQDYIDFMDTIAPVECLFKVGAQVMLTKNLSVETGLVNGSRGVIEELHEERIVVLFKSGLHVDIVPYRYEYEDEKAVCIREQFPLVLAYAMTVHKSMGATLDYVVADCGTSVFAPGQGYVLLSRVRTLEGLLLTNVMPELIKPHPKALKFENDLIKRSVLAKPIELKEEKEEKKDENEEKEGEPSS